MARMSYKNAKLLLDMSVGDGTDKSAAWEVVRNDINMTRITAVEMQILNSNIKSLCSGRAIEIWEKIRTNIKEVQPTAFNWDEFYGSLDCSKISCKNDCSLCKVIAEAAHDFTKELL